MNLFDALDLVVKPPKRDSSKPLRMSGFLGINLTEKGKALQEKEMPWWKGWKVTKKKKTIEGMNLFDALDLVVKPPKRDSSKPLRMPVSGVHKIKGVGDVITGRIEQGALRPNDP